MKFGAEQIECMLAILTLGSRNEVRQIEIQEELALSKPVVHKRLTALSKNEIIIMQKYGPVVFTEYGFEIAVKIQKKFLNIYPFFIDRLGLEENEAKLCTYRFLGNMTETCISRMQEYDKYSAVT